VIAFPRISNSSIGGAGRITSDMTYNARVALDAATLIRDARDRHGMSQQTLARRACTTQKQISRIERGEISPSAATLARLLAAMGERLELRAVPGPRSNASDAELRADFEQLTPGERVAQAAALSRLATGLAVGDD
jgi:transcriptional regulator with XRE-family HTH domain